MQPPAGEMQFRFDQFEVDVAAGELRRNGRRIYIQDKPLRLLVYLLQRPGQVVSRSDIQKHLWPPDTTVDFNDGLNTAMNKLREALRDNSDKPRYIETVPRRGYRFLGKLETLPQQTELPATNEIQSPPALVLHVAGPSPGDDRRSPMHLLLATAVLLAIAGCVTVAVRLTHARTTKAIADDHRQHSIVVLPFANLTGNATLSYLSDGVTEEVIARLAEEDPHGVRVIARTSAMSFRDTTMTAKQIGDALDVDYLLEGSLNGDKKHIRLIAQLVRASDQTHLWAKAYDGEPSQLKNFENDMADRAASSLPGTRHSGNGPQQIEIGAEAHDLYLQGLFALAQRSRSGFESALISFGDAIQKEPRYAQAYAELAVTYNLMGQYGWMLQDEARSQGRAAAMQALALDPSLAEAKAALGFSYWFYDWDNGLAEKELTSAVAEAPNSVDAHHWLAMVMLTSGRFDRAEQEMRTALSLDPNSLILQTNLAWVHYTEGRFPLAVKEMTAVVNERPDFLSAHVKLSWADSAMGDQQKAWAEFQSILRLGATPEAAQQIAKTYKNEGYHAALETLVSMPDGHFYSNDVDRARELIFADDHTGAIHMLQKGLKDHDGWMPFVPIDPAFAPLRNDAVFQQVVREIENKHTRPTVASF